jgi:hypothetical protein
MNKPDVEKHVCNGGVGELSHFPKYPHPYPDPCLICKIITLI